MKRTKTAPADVEALAEKAKLKRQSDCSEKINKILTESKCQLTVLVKIGEMFLPLEQVLALPVTINVISK